MKEYFKPFLLEGSIEIVLKTKGQKPKLWVADKKELCAAILAITEDFAEQGYRITLRQLYYQLVKAEVIPNHLTVYKKLGKVKDDMAYGGLLNWGTFEDRGRKPQKANTEENPKGAIERAYKYYNLDKQEGQLNHIEVWTEKDAISGILDRITKKYTVPLVINKGYSGSTAMYESYRRFLKALANGQDIKLIYFGDHDPSGLDMVRDITERIEFMLSRGENEFITEAVHWFTDKQDTFTAYDIAEMPGYEKAINILKPKPTAKVIQLFRAGATVLYLRTFELLKVQHVGLTMEQIKQYAPPPNPAKMEDPRANEYVKQFGEVSWEVDALTPKVMTEIVESAILSYMNTDTYKGILKQEEEDQKELLATVNFISLKGDKYKGITYLRNLNQWITTYTKKKNKTPIELIAAYEKRTTI